MNTRLSRREFLKVAAHGAAIAGLIISLILLISILLPLNCIFAQDSTTTLSIQGDVNKPMNWTVEQLKKQFTDQIKEVPFRARSDRPGKIGMGIPLLSLIQAASPKAEKESF